MSVTACRTGAGFAVPTSTVTKGRACGEDVDRRGAGPQVPRPYVAPLEQVALVA